MIESRRVPAMGSHATLTLVGADLGALDDVLAELARLEGLWSRFLPTSDLSRLNSAGGAPVRIDAATVGLLMTMQDAMAETDGAFDPTLLPALVESGYAASFVHPERTTLLLPDAASGGDLDDVRIDGLEVTLPPHLTIDSGGIGKGYAADRLAALTRARGATGAMIEIGGDLVVWGTAPDGVAWRIGIEDPDDAGRHIAEVRVSYGAVATSSTRKRRWSHGDIDVHHLIDPRTLHSVETDIASVSVLASSGARAEALAKYVLVNPLSDAMAWLESRNAAGLIVRGDGSILATASWEDYR